MSVTVDDISGLWGGSSADKSVDQRNQELNNNQALWERQFGPVSDALKTQMMGMLGQGPVQPESPWLTNYKNIQRQEIESGIRPGEEAARTALLDKVRANPMGISNQAYARGLKDIVTEGSKARGTAFRTGMANAELVPFNLGMSFMGRTPYNQPSTFAPDYKNTTLDTAKAVGSGLYETVKQGTSLYNSLFPARIDSGFGVSPTTNPIDVTDPAFNNLSL